jgi:acyl-CoA reductase-like NAD-dependent aldehyde dehydrogenase
MEKPEQVTAAPAESRSPVPVDPGAPIRTWNPASGDLVHEVEPADSGQIDRALDRARAAQPAWGALPVDERAEVLRRFADLLAAEADALAALIVAEVGKLRSYAEAEVAGTVATARYYADTPPPSERAGSAEVRRLPIGVVGVISPWNVPLVMPAWKWLPALMAGNAVAWKPSELAPGVAAATHRLLLAAGVPDDVVQFLPGRGDVGQALCRDPRVDAIHFIGSTAAGRQIAATVAPRFAPFSLEMGGSNPAIVFADADLDYAAESIAATVSSLQGQKCTTTRRVLAAAGVADELAALIGDRLATLRPGDPAQPQTTLGPLITPQAAASSRDAIAAALARGARVVAETPLDQIAGARPEGFVAATLLTDVATDDPLSRQELFAPVVTIAGFDGPEQAWGIANDTGYGLTGAVYTADEELQQAAAERLQVGVLAINRRTDHFELEAPFIGVKDSGHGFPDGGTYVYDGMTRLLTTYRADAAGEGGDR